MGCLLHAQCGLRVLARVHWLHAASGRLDACGTKHLCRVSAANFPSVHFVTPCVLQPRDASGGRHQLVGRPPRRQPQRLQRSASWRIRADQWRGPCASFSAAPVYREAVRELRLDSWPDCSNALLRCVQRVRRACLLLQRRLPANPLAQPQAQMLLRR